LAKKRAPGGPDFFKQWREISQHHPRSWLKKTFAILLFSVAARLAYDLEQKCGARNGATTNGGGAVFASRQ